MTARLALLSLLLVPAMLAAPALAQSTASYGPAFVAGFAEACVPQRMSYAGIQETARATGWSEVSRDAHPELAAMMAIADAAAAAEDLEDASLEQAIFSKSLEGTAHHLVVSRASMVVSDPEKPWVFIGCYLYNFDAAAPIAPEPVSELLGNEIAQSQADETITAYVWGPSCAMPRTLDTYLTYVPAGSTHAEQTGFTGLVLKFETSEPDEGEVVPETYC